MKSGLLRSVLLVFLFSNAAWIAAYAGVFLYLNGEAVSALAGLNARALVNILYTGETGIHLAQPVKLDSLQQVQVELLQEMNALRQRLVASQTTADSMDFEILLRQVKLSRLDSTATQEQVRQAKEQDAKIRQMAKIMASSPPETIDKMSNGMDDVLLAKIVAASNNRDAARILGALTPERVAQVTRQLTTEPTSR